MRFYRENLRSRTGILGSGARILSKYLEKHNGDYLQALWSYKGRGSNGLGLRQAKLILKGMG
jgi:hypothetical protein